MMIYKEIKSKTVYGAKRSRVTRALETMQCRKAGIINLSTKEETERFLYCFYLKEEFCL